MASPPCPSKPHVLLIPYPLPGHITPLLHLSQLLSARGFAVTFVSSEFTVRQILKSKQELPGVDLVGIADGLQENHSRDCMLEPVDFHASVAHLHKSFDKLVATMVEVDRLAITCIISDSFLVWTQDVANKWSIARVAFWPNSLTAFACSISLPRILAACPKLDPFKPATYDRAAGKEVLHCIPGISDIDACDLPFNTLDGENSEEWLRDHVQRLMARVNEAFCVICNTFPDLERGVHTHLKEILPSKSLFTLGPLFLSGACSGGQKEFATVGPGDTVASEVANESEECMRWLDTQPSCSVIFISLGTVAIIDEREMQEIALGLEATKQPFLWAVRSAPCATVLGWFSKVGRQRGKVIRWAPQAQVLSHEAVGGFLTHCGWNSTLESVSKGVPVITWPQMMDQRTNAWLLVDELKVGVRLELEEGPRVTRRGVQKAVSMLMQEDHGHLLRARASELASLAQSALSASLPFQLDNLVHSILSLPNSVVSLNSQT